MLDGLQIPKSWWEVSNSRKNAYNNIASWYTIGQTTEEEVRHNLTAEAGWYSGVDELIASPVFRDIMQWDSNKLLFASFLISAP